MFNKAAKMSKVTWKTILVNPFILGTMAIPAEEFLAKCTLFIGVMFILAGILGILWNIFF